MNGKIIEREKFGHGRGSIVLYEGTPNWKSNYCVNGKEHEQSTGTPDKKAARRWHKTKLDEIAAARQGLKKFVAPMTQRIRVNELVADYLADAELRLAKSIDKMRSAAKPMQEHFGAMRAADVTEEMGDRYIQIRRKAGKADATINRETTILCSAFRLALRRGKISSMPMIRKLPENNVRRVFYDKDEFDSILAVAPPYLVPVLKFYYLTGWRKSEVVGLNWSMVDMAAGTITIPTSKNGAGRHLALSGEIAILLKQQETTRLVEMPDGGVRVADHVFHRSGLTLGDFKNAWHATLIKAGFAHQVKGPDGKIILKSDGTPLYKFEKNIHDFRRTASRNLARAGVHPDVSMVITGHKTDSMRRRYNITDENDLRDAFERVSAYVNNRK
jgi:integrase